MTRYSTSQIALHWLTALLVLTNIALPYGHDFFGQFLGGDGGVFTLHKSIGLTVLLLTLLRLVARARYGAPQLLPPEARFQQVAAKAGHALLYLLLLAMPLTGLVFGKRPVNLFWLVEIAPLPLSDDTRALAKQFHLTAQYALYILILGHAAIALWHHFARRDGVLQGMLPIARR